jgi:hypothetical protein
MTTTRRDFIKKTAVGATGLAFAGLGLSARSYANILGSNERLNVAIIGLGRRLGAFYEPIAMTSSNASFKSFCSLQAGVKALLMRAKVTALYVFAKLHSNSATDQSFVIYCLCFNLIFNLCIHDFQITCFNIA